MLLRNICLSLVTIATLAACGKNSPDDAAAICSAEETKTAFAQQFKTDVLKNFQQYQQDDKQLVKLSLDAIGLDLDKVKVVLEDIRPQSLGNDSEKVSCIAQLTVSLPENMINEAQVKAKKMTYGFDINRDAQLNGFEVFIDNAFKTNVQYSVNPKQKNAIEEDKGSASAALLKNLFIIRNVDKNPYEGMEQPGFAQAASDVPASSVPEGDPLGNLLNKIDKEMAASETGTAPTDNTGNAQSDANNAVLQSAKQKNQQARGQIDRIWNGLPAEVKDSLKNEEQNWKNNRIKSCGQESDATKQLECETNSINKRIGELKQYSVD